MVLCVDPSAQLPLLVTPSYMWYGKHLRRLRKARQALKNQQQQLLDLELEGFVALTIHTMTHSITVPVEVSVAMQAADLLREELRNQRRRFKLDAQQIRQDWSESEVLRARAKAKH